MVVGVLAAEAVDTHFGRHEDDEDVEQDGGEDEDGDECCGCGSVGG